MPPPPSPLPCVNKYRVMWGRDGIRWTPAAKSLYRSIFKKRRPRGFGVFIVIWSMIWRCTSTRWFTSWILICQSFTISYDQLHWTFSFNYAHCTGCQALIILSIHKGVYTGRGQKFFDVVLFSSFPPFPISWDSEWSLAVFLIPLQQIRVQGWNSWTAFYLRFLGINSSLLRLESLSTL